MNKEKIHYVLFIGDGDMHAQLEQSFMQRAYDYIFSLENINLYFKGCTGDVNNMPETVKQLESYVPCELYLKYFDLVVGCFSSVIESSIKVGIPTISYIELVKNGFYDSSLYDVWKERLDDYGCGKLLYPSSFVELKDMIYNYKGNII